MLHDLFTCPEFCPSEGDRSPRGGGTVYRSPFTVHRSSFTVHRSEQPWCVKHNDCNSVCNISTPIARLSLAPAEAGFERCARSRVSQFPEFRSGAQGVGLRAASAFSAAVNHRDQRGCPFRTHGVPTFLPVPQVGPPTRTHAVISRCLVASTTQSRPAGVWAPSARRLRQRSARWSASIPTPTFSAPPHFVGTAMAPTIREGDCDERAPQGSIQQPNPNGEVPIAPSRGHEAQVASRGDAITPFSTRGGRRRPSPSYGADTEPACFTC
eukprot:363221-Chlamydomonas_euryale.AAC.11